MTITKKANSIIYLIRKTFSHMPHDLLIKIYKTYIRPFLEYGFQLWNPYFEKDIQLLERVQRRFTKLGAGLKNMEYEDRLRILRLPLLSSRRKRGDLIETYKILHGHYNCPVLESMFHLNQNRHLRGHTLKLNKQKFQLNPWKNILFNRVVDDWNGLPAELVNSVNVNVFKNGYDSLFDEM